MRHNCTTGNNTAFVVTWEDEWWMTAPCQKYMFTIKRLVGEIQHNHSLDITQRETKYDRRRQHELECPEGGSTIRFYHYNGNWNYLIADQRCCVSNSYEQKRKI